MRGPRLSVLHRWIGLSVTYDLDRTDEPAAGELSHWLWSFGFDYFLW